jgi:hypothetical protein
MPVAPLAEPLRFEPGMEVPEKDEAETGRRLVETLKTISETTWKDGHHALRAVHAKSHGLLKARLVVNEGLPEVLAQGLFAKPGTYPAAMRFSTSPGDILDDRVSTPRGLAIKVLDVHGPRLPGSEGDMTQDFLLVDGPTFPTATAKAFLGNLKLLAGTTDKAEGLKVALSAALQATERAVEKIRHEPSGLLVGLGGHPETNILGETFHTQAPMLYGPYVAKLAVVPISPNLTALTGAPVDLHHHPDGLREAVLAAFGATGGEWEVRVQLARDLETTPIEDSSKLWPEDVTPFVPVARLVADIQTAWSKSRQTAVDDGMAFSPWHGLAAHRPLGSIMRVRKAAYEMSADFRARRNRCPILEPLSLSVTMV